jgi:hypothetical protein
LKEAINGYDNQPLRRSKNESAFILASFSRDTRHWNNQFVASRSTHMTTAEKIIPTVLPQEAPAAPRVLYPPPPEAHDCSTCARTMTVAVTLGCSGVKSDCIYPKCPVNGAYANRPWHSEFDGVAIRLPGESACKKPG